MDAGPTTPEEVHQAIEDALSRVAGLVCAYLFGSRARGTARASSDYDIGVWLEEAPSTLDDYPFELAANLEERLGAPVDLVVLNRAPSDLVHRVLRDGQLLGERNRSLRIQLEVKSRNDYFDMEPIRRLYRAPRARVSS